MNYLRKYRRGIARCLLPFVSLWLCVMPQQAYAFVPAAIGGYGLPSAASVATASGGATAAAAVGAVDLFAGAGLIVVGATIGYFAVDYLTSDNQPHTVRIPLTDTPAMAVPAPTGAPATAAKVPEYYYLIGPTGQPHYTSYAEACAPYGSLGGSVCNGVTYDGCVAVGYSNCVVGQIYSFSMGMSSTLACPPGYLLNNSVCYLSNSRQVIADNACDIQRSGGSALAMISDPECAASGSNAYMPIICDGVTFKCSGRGLNNGRPVQFEIQAHANGGSTVQTQTQNSVNGQTQVETTTIEVNSGGQVESVSGQVQAGSIASPSGSTSTAASVVPTVDTGVAPFQGSTGTATQPITFPNDYARTGEAASASTGTQTRLDTLHNDLTAQTSVGDPVVPVAGDMPTWGNTFTNLLSFQLPAHTSTCPQPSIDLSSMFGAGQVFTITAHCTLANQNAAPLSTAFAAMFTIMALFIVLRA